MSAYTQLPGCVQVSMKKQTEILYQRNHTETKSTIEDKSRYITSIKKHPNGQLQQGEGDLLLEGSACLLPAARQLRLQWSAIELGLMLGHWTCSFSDTTFPRRPALFFRQSSLPPITSSIHQELLELSQAIILLLDVSIIKSLIKLTLIISILT